MINLFIFLEGKGYFGSYYFDKILYFKLKKNLHLVAVIIFKKNKTLKIYIENTKTLKNAKNWSKCTH